MQKLYIAKTAEAAELRSRRLVAALLLLLFHQESLKEKYPITLVKFMVGLKNYH